MKKFSIFKDDFYNEKLTYLYYDLITNYNMDIKYIKRINNIIYFYFEKKRVIGIKIEDFKISYVTELSEYIHMSFKQLTRRC